MSTWLRLIGATVSVSLVALSCGGNSTTAPADVKSGMDASVSEEPAAGGTPPAALHMAILRQQQTAPGYDFLPASDGVLHSRGGPLDVAAQPAGVHLAQGSGLTAFSLGVATTSVGRTDGSILSRAVVAQHAEGQELVVSHDGNVEERFLSGPLGLEQSYTLTQRPAGSGAVAIQVRFDGLLPALVAGSSDHVRLNDATGAERGGYSDLVAVDASGRSLDAKMEVAGGGVSLVIDDRGATYPVRVDPVVWTLQQEIDAPTPAAGDFFGYSVSVSGSLAILGAPNHSAGAGAAYVFLQIGTTWALQQQLTAGDAAAGDGFGTSVAVSGTLAIVGAPSHKIGTAAGAGAAYVFTQSGTTWPQASELTAGDAAASDGFGTSVSISSSTKENAAIVGSPNHTVGAATGVGTAYVFVQNGVTWPQQSELVSGGAAGDGFGTSVSITSSASGASAVVGAPYHTVGSNTEAGAAYAFGQSGTTWPLQTTLFADNGADFDGFGTSVSVSGSNAIVGAPYHKANGHSEAGGAYAFVQSAGAWTLQQDLTASDGKLGDLFGFSVSVSGSSAIIGAYQHDVAGTESAGAAYLFFQTCPTWTQTTELTASDDGVSDFFGYAVAVSPTTAIVGAYDHNQTGAVSAGSAYLYGGVSSALGCCISDVAVTAGTVNPADACQVCTPATSTTTWTNEPDDTTCPGGVCISGACASDCFIGGVVYSAGTVNPANSCQVCTPATSSTTWSSEANGTTCNDGNACTQTDSCQAGVCLGTNPVTCTASDQCHTAGTCNTTTGVCSNPTATNGTTCNDGNLCTSSDVCTSGICGGTAFSCTPTSCQVSSTCNGTSCTIVDDPSGTTCPSDGNPCHADTCDSSGTCTHPNLPNGTSCGAGQVCSTGTCSAGCFIGGTLYPSGTVNPANACQACVPATSTTTWSNVADGTTCNDGNACTSLDVCTAGTCGGSAYTCTATTCELSSTCDGLGGCTIVDDPSGTTCPSDGNPCHADTCDGSGTCSHPSLPDGTSCGAGQVCSTGTCSAGCFIGGTLYPSGTVNPANACEVCTPATSTTTWSSEPDGTGCATGEVCTSGACAADCFIGGTLYPSGTVNPANACQVCTPATSTTTWSNESDGSSCGASGEVCSGGTCASDCFIGGTLYPSGTVNPADACQVCAPGTSTSTWSNEPDGSSCATGEVCTTGACSADCFIGGTLYPSGTVNPANACQVCTPATSTTTWSNEPNGADCGSGEICSSGTCGTECFIGGVVIPSGTVNSANACQVCSPGVSTTAWSNEPNGLSCGSGEVCSTGTCASDCFVSGVLYPAGTVNPVNACQVCTPATSTTAWTNESNGTSCGSGEICSSGTCGTECFIGGTVYPSGTVNPANACQVCSPGLSTTAWTNEPSGTACGGGEVCSSGGTCASDCFIGGTLVAAGAVNPANACEVCTPATSTTTWSNEPNGLACGTGDVCSSGACTADCFIGGVLYPSGTVNAADVCQICAPTSSTTAWSNEPNGMACGAGEVCGGGVCASDCFIGGTLFPAGTVNPADACQICAPATSTTTWSNEPDGSGCGVNDVCSSGTCASDCFIAGILYPSGTVNPANACQVCAPATSTTTWSNESDGLSCATGEVCSSGACSADCFIGGTLFPGGTVNPADACEVCTPATSTTAWSNEPDGASCGTGEVCTAGACASDCFIGGVVYPSGTVNPANACQVCTPATSTTTWSNEPSGTSCASGEVCSSTGTCATDCFIGGTLYPSGTVNPANACQVCTPATSTTTWSNEPSGTACATGEVCSSTGTCAADCFIGGTLYPSGTVNPINACQVCTPGTSTTTWSNESNGSSCGGGEVCSAGVCGTDCFIGGTVIPSGTVNPANACQVCSPGLSTTAWSNEPSGTGCASGEVCSSTGTCASDCFIGGVLYPSGTVNPANACLVCTPAHSTTAWSNEPSGTSCGSGQVCGSGTCAADCFIGGTLYPSGTVNPINACQVCTPATSTTTWSNESNGTVCGSGQICSSGTCGTECFIGGTVFPSGTVNPANACQVCSPGLSTTAWSNEPGGTSCGAGEVCGNSGTCGADCFIQGTLIPSGTVNPANACEVCAPTSATTTWSNANNGTACNDGNACTQTDTCQAGACTGSNPVTCTSSDQCHAAGICNPSTGACSNPADPNGTTCNDGNACSANDMCTNGACGGTSYTCIPSACQASSVCNGTGSCTTTPAQDGTPCGSQEVCASGLCVAAPVDAGTPADSGSPISDDAGIDSGVDAGVDAGSPSEDSGVTEDSGADAEASDAGIAGDASDAGDSGQVTPGEDSGTGEDSGSAVDSGSPDEDSGITAPDAAVSSEDSGLVASDAGDAGLPNNGTIEGGGCSCRTQGARDTGSDGVLFGLSGLILVATRRRRRGR